ncbi:MAG: hypothetical protein D6719_04340 [Candidatus Dadabacteria bacterium]|nr:MAG: hypothetical protein D6719_04340 [Candidatus Dadabacteria bacterium]
MAFEFLLNLIYSLYAMSTQPDSVPAMTRQQKEYTSTRSGFSAYRHMTVGESSLAFLVYYELVNFCFSNVAGLAGYGLRALFYRKLFERCGKRPAIGKGVLLRNPAQVQIGDKLLLDDYAVLDAHDNGKIKIGGYVSIGRYTTVAAKGGRVVLKNGVNIGSYCRIATHSKIEIGESTLVAAYCYIGPGNHQQGDQETPLIARDMDIKGGVKIGKHCWLGTRVTVLDGVTIGDRAIIAAHSFVKDDVPAGAVVAGIPAKILRYQDG